MIYSKLINHTTDKGSQIYLNDHQAIIKVHQKKGKHGDCTPAFRSLKSDDILILHQKANRPNVITHIVRVINGNQLIEDHMSSPLYPFIRNCEVLYYLDPQKTRSIKTTGESYIFNTNLKSVSMQDMYGSTNFYVGNGNCKAYPYSYDDLIAKISKHSSYSKI